MPRQNLNFRARSVMLFLVAGAGGCGVVSALFQTHPIYLAWTWITIGLIGTGYATNSARENIVDLIYLKDQGENGPTLVWKRAYTRSAILYFIAHATFLQLGVVSLFVQRRLPPYWLRVHLTASLIFAIYVLALNLILDSTLHRRMGEAERRERAKAG